MSKIQAAEKTRKPGQITHGVHTWLRTGKINPSIRGFKRIQKYLRDVEKDLIADLGGPENITVAQELLIKSTIQAQGVLLLAGAFSQKYSILRPDMAKRGILELQPVLGKQFCAFLNTIRQNLIVLGLERKAGEPEASLADIIREIDEKSALEKAAAEKAQAQGKEAEEAEKGDPERAGEGIPGGQGEGQGET